MQVATEQGTWPFMTKVQKESGRFFEIKRAVIQICTVYTVIVYNSNIVYTIYICLSTSEKIMISP